jgi:transcriptional regulator with XRE-family HTH domain
MTITTAQIRGARGILNWSQADLAERTGISATSVGSIENGQSTPRASTLQTIQKSFEDAGIEFIGLEGMRHKTGDVRVYRGQSGFVDFFNLVYQVARDQGGEILVSNVEERRFLKWAKNTADSHMERMSSLQGISFRVLLKEGDVDFAASSYAQYKWLPDQYFSSVPFYAFGDKLAVMLLENEPVIVVLDFPAVAQAFRIQFNAMWELAHAPEKKQSA